MSKKLIFIVIFVLASTFSFVSHAAEPTYGVNPGISFLLYQQDAGPEPTRDLQAMKAAGIQEVRADVVWAFVVSDQEAKASASSPKNTKYNWSLTDRTAISLAKNNMRWYARIGYPPNFYSADPALVFGGEPKDQYLNNFAEFSKAFAARYGTNGIFWKENPSLPYLPVNDFEIWNEPNLPGTMTVTGKNSAVKYMKMYTLAYKAIKTVQPESRIPFGSLAVLGDTAVWGSISASDWLKTSIASNKAQKIDAVSMHPYAFDFTNSSLTEGMWNQIRPIRSAMDTAGLASVPIHANEYGFASDYGVFGGTDKDKQTILNDEQRKRAMYTSTLQMAHSDCNVTSLAPLNWNTTQIANSTNDPFWTFTQFAMASPTSELNGAGLGYKDAIANAASLKGTVFPICKPFTAYVPTGNFVFTNNKTKIPCRASHSGLSACQVDVFSQSGQLVATGTNRFDYGISSGNIEVALNDVGIKNLTCSNKNFKVLVSAQHFKGDTSQKLSQSLMLKKDCTPAKTKK